MSRRIKQLPDLLSRCMLHRSCVWDCRAKGKKMRIFMNRFAADECGATMVEYTILIGMMLVAVIGFIVIVGGWVTTQWSTLAAAL